MFGVVVSAALGQRLQQRPLLEAGAAAAVDLGHYPIEEALVVLEGVEIVAVAQHQGLVNAAFEVTVSRFDGSVLVALGRVVASGFERVMPTQIVVAVGEVGFLRSVLESGGEAVGAVLSGHATAAPQGILQASGQGRVALATAGDFDIGPAAEHQTVVIEHVGEGLTGEGDFDAFEVGEIGDTHAARHLALTEHHFLLGTVFDLPRLDTALQRACNTAIKIIGITFTQQLQQGRGQQPRVRFERGQQVALPDGGQWIFTCAPMARRRGIEIEFALIDTAGRALGDTGFGGGTGLGTALLAMVHK